MSSARLRKVDRPIVDHCVAAARKSVIESHFKRVGTYTQERYSLVDLNQLRRPNSSAARLRLFCSLAVLMPFPWRSTLARWSQSKSSSVLRLARLLMPQIWNSLLELEKGTLSGSFCGGTHEHGTVTLAYRERGHTFTALACTKRGSPRWSICTSV